MNIAWLRNRSPEFRRLQTQQLERDLSELPHGDRRELDRFLDLFAHSYAWLAKPDHYAIVTESGYFCSQCNAQLTEEQAGWVYCASCTTPLACCDDDELCDRCRPEVYRLVDEAYARAQVRKSEQPEQTD
ncbi:MAG: hypothetical protein V1659_00380 [Candidatus Woesearchaeota archaeon]